MKPVLKILITGVLLLPTFLFAQNNSALNKKELPPPTNFIANIINGDDVEMTWDSPYGIGFMQWDAGTNTGNGIGLTNGGTFYVASRWIPADLVPYDSSWITKISIFPNDDESAQFVLKAWTGENASIEILSQQVESYFVDEFNEIELDTPILIDASEELWFGYEITNEAGLLPAGCDDGPAVQNFGDMISLDGTAWEGMSETYGLDYNWNIAGYLVSDLSDKSDIAQPMLKKIKQNPSMGDLKASGPNSSLSKTQENKLFTFLGYNVYFNDEIIAEQISETEFIYEDLVPSYEMWFDVKAVYEEGISEGAGPIQLIFGYLIERELVVVESAININNPESVGTEMGMLDFKENNLWVAQITYHIGDEYETEESVARLEYLGLDQTPSTWFDNVYIHAGGHPTQSLYETFLPLYQNRRDTPTIFNILHAEWYETGGTNYSIDVEIEMLDLYPNVENLVFQAVLTESYLPENWQGTMDKVNFVCRDMIPNENGTPLDFSTNFIFTTTLDFEIPVSYMMDNLEVLVFVQDMNTKEILQADEAYMIMSSDKHKAEERIKLFPNPANQHINISSSSNIESLKIYNYTGELILVKDINSHSCLLNTSELDAGIYLFNIQTEDGEIVKRIVIK